MFTKKPKRGFVREKFENKGLAREHFAKIGLVKKYSKYKDRDFA